MSKWSENVPIDDYTIATLVDSADLFGFQLFQLARAEKRQA